MRNAGSFFETGSRMVVLAGQSFMVGLIALALAGAPAVAQKAPAKSANGKTAKKAGAKKSKQSAWVKLCETAKLRALPAKKGDKPKIVTKKICLTHHERLDGGSGLVIVSAAIREVEGQKKKQLLIMVPLGMAIPAGVQAKIDDQKDPIKLRFSLCHAGGCTAEVEATPDILKKMKKGNKMIVASLTASGRPFRALVPLTGFAKTNAGKPIDNKVYAQARRNLMLQIRARQIEKLKAARKIAAQNKAAADAKAGTQPKKK